MNMVKLNSPSMKKELLACEAWEDCKPVCLSFLSQCASASFPGLACSSSLILIIPCFNIAQHSFAVIMKPRCTCLPDAKL